MKRKCSVEPDYTTEYAQRVVLEEIPVCIWEKLACRRHLNDLERVKNNDYPYTFDLTRANRIIKWFLMCNHIRGSFAGQPIELDSWQKFDLGCIFGWVDKKTGVRRFKIAYIRVARGNAKSTMMSGIALYGLCGDALYVPGSKDVRLYELQPEIQCAAVDRSQANRVWGDARAIALLSPKIFKHLDVKRGTISHKVRGGFFEKLSKDIKNKDSGAPCMIIIDEYHAHPTSMIKDTVSSGKGKRWQCLEFIITTAGEDAENKPCKIEDDIVKQILQGVIEDDHYFGMIRELDEGDDPHDEKVWVKSNPLFQNENEYSKILYNQVKEEHDLAFGSNDASKIRQWMIKRANLWQEECEEKYMAGRMDTWKELAVSREKFVELTRGKQCYNGGDMSKTTDLTAVGYVFPLEEGRFAVCAHGFIPSEAVTKHEHTDRVPYRFWSREGWCTIVPGAVSDDSAIKAHVKRMETDNGWKMVELCYDPWGARQFLVDMEKEGYTCVEVRQGIPSLSAPTKKLRELIIQGRIVHDGSPILTWCLSNALEIRDNNENIKLSKKHKDDTQRIDLLSSVINAMHRAMLKEDTEYAYNKHGMREL